MGGGEVFVAVDELEVVGIFPEGMEDTSCHDSPAFGGSVVISSARLFKKNKKGKEKKNSQCVILYNKYGDPWVQRQHF